MKILLIGCGNIGGTLLRRWLASDFIREIIVIDPSMRNQASFAIDNHVNFYANIKQVPESFVEDMIVIAVKPQHFADVALHIKQRNSAATIISAVAGVNVEKIKSYLPFHCNIIRVMPNIALQNGHSVNLTFKSSTVSDHAMQNYEHILSGTGSIFMLEHEEQIDSLTPIFGSGPAYFFLLAELLQKQAVKFGIDERCALQMTNLLIKGIASHVKNDTPYDENISAVASKKGVTEAALEVMKDGMRKVIEDSLAVALKRVEELKNENCD